MNGLPSGYPNTCIDCHSFAQSSLQLRVFPYYKEGTRPKVMLIGQDPTIYRRPERVTHVLMLNEKNGQLSRWLRGLFGEAHYAVLTLYATNLVKCSFKKPPSTMEEGGFRFLRPYFGCCQKYIKAEIKSFQPDLVLTLGEPAHRLFRTILDDGEIPDRMQVAYTGKFIRTKMDSLEFDYSPCLHISTFRVAEVYGESVRKFKRGIFDYFQTDWIGRASVASRC